MLKKQYRLRKNTEFFATYIQKKYVSSFFFTLNIGKLKTNELQIMKVAFVVSKKIDKRAVVRNLIKRRMREAYQRLINDTEINTNKWISIIFTAKKNCKEANFSNIYEQMKKDLIRACEKYD